MDTGLVLSCSWSSWCFCSWGGGGGLACVFCFSLPSLFFSALSFSRGDFFFILHLVNIVNTTFLFSLKLLFLSVVVFLK